MLKKSNYLKYSYIRENINWNALKSNLKLLIISFKYISIFGEWLSSWPAMDKSMLSTVLNTFGTCYSVIVAVAWQRFSLRRGTFSSSMQKTRSSKQLQKKKLHGSCWETVRVTESVQSSPFTYLGAFGTDTLQSERRSDERLHPVKRYCRSGSWQAWEKIIT